MTGGSGSFGQVLVPQLADLGYHLRATSRTARESDRTDIEWCTLDLENDTGLDEALADVDTIVHAASAPRGRSEQVDVRGTARLLERAEAVGVRHFVYISIVGVDRIPLKYYRHKLAAEKLIQEANVPWSILRATQFHSLIDMFLHAPNRSPVFFLPTKWLIQPMLGAEAARRLVEVVKSGPGQRLPDIGGPEVLEFGDMARRWLVARGQRRRVVHLPVPGQLGRALESGYLTTPEGTYGQTTWAEWLRLRYASG